MNLHQKWHSISILEHGLSQTARHRGLVPAWLNDTDIEAGEAIANICILIAEVLRQLNLSKSVWSSNITCFS